VPQFYWCGRRDEPAQGFPQGILSPFLTGRFSHASAKVAPAMIESPTIRAAAARAFQKIRPAFARELKRWPHNPYGSWNLALKQTEAAFALPGWKLFPVRFFHAPVRDLAFAAFHIPAANLDDPGFWRAFVCVAECPLRTVRDLAKEMGVDPHRAAGMIATYRHQHWTRQ
jgi:hypothetical protein